VRVDTIAVEAAKGLGKHNHTPFQKFSPYLVSLPVGCVDFINMTLALSQMLFIFSCFLTAR
jgi:hypothetical protein